MNSIDFTFSDTVAGYVTAFDPNTNMVTVKTSDGREFQGRVTDATYSERARKLGANWTDGGGSYADTLQMGRYVYLHGVFYPDNGATSFDVKHILFPGNGTNHFFSEDPDWWVDQVKSIGDFYLNAQFEGGPIDYKNYRTRLFLNGDKGGDVRSPGGTVRSRTVFGFSAEQPVIDDTRQETDTISRTVYGFATAFLMTGEDRFLEAAEKGTKYLQDVMCKRDKEDQGIVYWLHATNVNPDGSVKEILASQFGDDYGGMPCYEQIYALAGPIQTYRITGDPSIYEDTVKTIKLFDEYYQDKGQYGSYYSHLDPDSFDARDPKLGHNQSRKNWNSVGDHAPAYLINLCLATGEKRWEDMLVRTADTIAEHFPDYDFSPFMNEKFNEDWSHDLNTPLQKNRAIVGHNLKVAWNLTRVFHVNPNPKYQEFAAKIAELMPEVGMDKQRGGWYDMVERSLAEGDKTYRLLWHDRKAWWQQEQGILAYLILGGAYKKPEYLKLARESAAFYSSWFLDTDSGAVYFNTLANGMPYLLGNERLKGSHSMGAYHSTELCYLAAVYTNLLITKNPMDFYFKPQPGGFKDNILRVSPDMLPKGSIKIGAVEVDGQSYTDFDAEALTVKIPTTATAPKIKVTIVPV